MVVYRNGLPPEMGSYNDGMISYDSDSETIGSDSENQKDSSKMVARAVLVKKQNSHPFVDRTLNLEWPQKIGRSVARARPASNNGIFDCKVLSRNHALIWFEDNKFFLQDTKSSNGTFVNNQRLSKGSEESVPREIFSGDVIQFGVDVIENSKRVTHGCIVATVKLFHPDGREAKPSEGSNTVGHQQLFEINQYLQEAQIREEKLQSKLQSIQGILTSAKQASASGWQALMAEDRLLSRIQHLEDQLATYMKNHPEDKLREDIRRLIDEKEKYENSAKESLCKAIQEKNDTLKRLKAVERSLSSVEEECATLRQLTQTKDLELSDILEKYEQQLKNVESLESKLNETLDKYQSDLKLWEEEKGRLEGKLLELQVGILPHPDGERGKIEAELILKKEDKEKTDGMTGEDRDGDNNEKEDKNGESEQLEILQKRVVDLESMLATLAAEKQSQSENDKNLTVIDNNPEHEQWPTEDEINRANTMEAEVQHLKELISESREAQRKVELEASEVRKDLEEARGEAHDAWGAAARLRQQLRDLSTLLPALSNSSDDDENDGEEVDHDDSFDSEAAGLSARLQQRIMALRRRHLEAVDSVTAYEAELPVLKRRLLDAETVVNAQEKLISSLRAKQGDEDEESEANQLQEENLRLQDDCAQLRLRVQELSGTIERYDVEMSNLRVDCARLESVLEEDRPVPATLKSVDSSSRHSLNSQGLSESSISSVLDSTRRELDELRSKFDAATAGKFSLQAEYEAVRSELRSYASQSRVTFGWVLIPLLLVFLAIMIAFRPSG